ncbi:TPA: helix-turn-helix domain-containing protein [Streptococcus agalactiae]
MNRLKELRTNQKKTQQDMSEFLNMSRRGYQKIENGESQIKPDKAQALADYFGVSVGYLLGYENNYDSVLDSISNLAGYDDYQKIKMKLSIEISVLEHLLDDESENFSKTAEFFKAFSLQEVEKGQLKNSDILQLLNATAFLSSSVEALERLRYNIKKLAED